MGLGTRLTFATDVYSWFLLIVQFTDIGVVSSIEVNHKTVDLARKGEEVCIKVEATGGEAPRLYGRHFDHTDVLVSKVQRYPPLY